MRRRTLPRHAPALALALGLTAAAAAAPAESQDRFYLGMDAMNWSYDEDAGRDFSSLGVRGRLGVRLNPMFSIEAHLGGTGTDRSGDERRELDFLYAGLVRGDIGITRYTSVYGVMGAAGIEMSGRDANDNSVSIRETGVSLGIGLDFSISQGASLNVDYMRYIDSSDLDFSAISAGGRWAF